jgi:putative oxidoreductase
MHRTAWALQVLLGVYFIAIGVVHLIVPEGLPDQLEWMYDLPTWAHWASGVAEILGGLGLILPGLTRIRPELTPLAAAGLTLVMLMAAVYHLSRGEAQNLVSNLVIAALAAFIAYVRWRRHPLGAPASEGRRHPRQGVPG